MAVLHLQPPLHTPRKWPDTALLHGRISLCMLQKNNIEPIYVLKSNVRLTPWGARDNAIICRFFAEWTLQKNNMIPKCRTIVTEHMWENKNS